ncbi:hypothetical protein FA09DRAFT_326260 [Tilletiopsis washingtonensis]|uniref:F-box domain-containing protein n=1 Tax=Tilletiopsis washingtonensis TaxID=58919 RepID=A0A316Z3H9_9BASI|nr:hypothetical protein FA09DRAFT_326260 [Tilletiopsis washingtonensis]PWN96149.1 hypothetical protein FA09DRAFT_326260 [Tilletiopsis washingtonensis]
MSNKKQKLFASDAASASTSSSSEQQQQQDKPVATISSSGPGWAQLQHALEQSATRHVVSEHASPTGLEDLPPELLVMIRDLISSDHDLVMLSCASPLMRRTLLHEDADEWDRRSSCKSREVQAKLDDNPSNDHLTAKERFKMLAPEGIGARQCSARARMGRSAQLLLCFSRTQI